MFVGTGKGLFILEADGPNEAFSISAPLCDLWPINDIHASIESERIWAAGGSDDFGAGVWRSEDEGRSWRLSKLSNGNFDRFMLDYPDFAEENNIPPPEIAPHNDDVTAMWSVAMVGERLFAGGKPGRLYLSDDGGENFSLVESFARQPGSDEWQPGYAGLIPHTIASTPGDARRIWIGMSAVGVFASEDGGIGWELRNRRSNTGSGPSDIGPCVHNLAIASTDEGEGVLYQQNHHGVFISLDGARSWSEIGHGLPSTFGFPIEVHPRKPDTLWTFPLKSDWERHPPDARAAVWKSVDGGQSWAPRGEGLPARDCYFTVLRQAMSCDRRLASGLYFGTGSGSVFASFDEGDSWREIARHLPAVRCIEAT